MSQLEVNSIDKYSGNNLSVGSQLNLKSYTTTARNALTSVAGDTIYNTTDNKVQVYNGSSWDDLGGPAIFDVDFLVVAGGAAGGNCYGAGGGAGGLRSSVGNTGGGGSLESALSIVAGKPYLITVGGGGSGTLRVQYLNGSDSIFHTISTKGGGGGAGFFNGGAATQGGNYQDGATGGSGVVILRYPKAFTITVGGSLTSSTATDGDYKVTTFTAGTDNVSWA